MRERIERYRLPLGAAAGLLLLWLTLFSVRETEFVLITQFGQPIRTITTPGLHYKIPFIQSVMDAVQQAVVGGGSSGFAN